MARNQSVPKRVLALEPQPGGKARGAAHANRLGLAGEKPGPIPTGHREATRVMSGRRRKKVIDGFGGRRVSGAIRAPCHCTLIVPLINAACPGKLQKNSYGPPSLILLTAKLTDVVWPPPIKSVFATTRASPALT